MNILITICGRAGSKGVKNKNIRNFLGIPLIKYTIAAANLFKAKNQNYSIDISINSDSEDILNMFNSSKEINCIKRPTELAQDNSAKVPVIRHSLKYMENKLNKVYDFIIDLDITSPLRTAGDIQNVLNKAMGTTNIDTVFSVVPSRRSPYFNMVEERDGKIQRIIPANFVTRQESPKVYDMNASIYCYQRRSLLDVLENSPLDGCCDIVLMKDRAVLDIDSEEDFILMEIMARYFIENELKELYECAKRQ